MPFVKIPDNKNAIGKNASRPLDENANSEKRFHLYKAMIYNAIYEPT